MGRNSSHLIDRRAYVWLSLCRTSQWDLQHTAELRIGNPVIKQRHILIFAAETQAVTVTTGPPHGPIAVRVAVARESRVIVGSRVAPEIEHTSYNDITLLFKMGSPFLRCKNFRPLPACLPIHPDTTIKPPQMHRDVCTWSMINGCEILHGSKNAHGNTTWQRPPANFSLHSRVAREPQVPGLAWPPEWYTSGW